MRERQSSKRFFLSFFQIFEIFVVLLLESGAWFGRSGGGEICWRGSDEKEHLVVVEVEAPISLQETPSRPHIRGGETGHHLTQAMMMIRLGSGPPEAMDSYGEWSET
jgi:hypothetical protein